MFTNLLLADEINRTPPKTQAALLEAMEERQVSVDGEARPLPDPFIVAATQNPIEYEGTYQLPEAQLDRFLLKLNVPLPPRDQEIAILSRHAQGFDPRDLSAVQPVAGPAELAAGREAVRRVLVADEVLGYIVDIVGATRHSPSLQLGVSPRGATALLATARSWAWLSGRNYVTPDDVKAMARPTLRHRIALRPEAELEGATPDGVLDGILAVGAGTALVVLTGRAGLVALICVLPIGVVALARNGFRGAAGPAAGRAVAVDVALAASTRRLRFTRLGDSAARLGEPVDAALIVENPGAPRFRGLDPRRLGAVGARASRARTRWTSLRDNASGSTRRLRPMRRGDQRVGTGHRALGGPAGAGGQAELAPGAVAGPDPAAVPVPQAPAVAAGQAARTRRHDPGADPRPGHRIRLAARVRRRRRRPVDRLARHRAPRRRRGADVAAGTRPPGGHRARHRADVGGPGRRRPHRRRPERLAAAGLVDGRRTAVGGVGLPRR